MKAIEKKLETCLQQNEKDFIRVLAIHIRRDLPDTVEGLSDLELQRMVFYGIKKAKSYGFAFDVDIAAFVTVMFDVAPNFDDHPLIQQVLTDEFDTSGERFDRLFEKIPSDVWGEAKSLYDADAWIPQLKAGRNTRLQRYTQVNRS